MLEQLYVYGVHAIYMICTFSSPFLLTLSLPLSLPSSVSLPGHIHACARTLLLMHIHVRTCIGLGIAVGGTLTRIPGFMRVIVCVCVCVCVFVGSCLATKVFCRLHRKVG